MLPMPTDPTEQNNVPQIVPLRIWIDHEAIDGQGHYREVEWVEYAKKGTNGATTVEKVSRMMKGDPILWNVIKPAYDHWKTGQQEPVDGTPLSVWPGVSTSQAEHLKLLHLRSVEDVAQANDATLERVGMGARALREKARAFVQAKQGQAVVADAMAAKDAQIAALTERLADLSKTVESLKSAMPRRGRPPKERPADVAGRQ